MRRPARKSQVGGGKVGVCVGGEVVTKDCNVNSKNNNAAVHS